MQLIQYAPTTEQVHRRPLLIIPPWINKFYILDLQPKNSFIKWAVEQGHTVFVISWVNPDEKLAAEELRGLHAGGAAGGARRDRAGDRREANQCHRLLPRRHPARLHPRLHGGEARQPGQQARPSSPRWSISPTRASSASSSTRSSSRALEQRMDKKRLSRRQRTWRTTFNMLRANDLIWSFVVNNYLLGKEPFPFDLLYWNSDSTRMPAAMHSFYLRNMYQQNRLAKPGGITLAACRSICARSSTRPISCRPSRTISRHGNRPTPATSSCRARCVSCWAARAISPAWSIRRGNKYHYWTMTNSLRPPTNGWQLRSSTGGHGGATGPSGSRTARANRSPRGNRGTAGCLRLRTRQERTSRPGLTKSIDTECDSVG